MSAVIKEVLAGTINRDLVDDVEGMDPTYIDPLMEDTTDELFASMDGALRNYLMEKARQAGYTMNPAWEKNFTITSAKAIGEITSRMGSVGVGSSLTVRTGTHKGKKGYIASIPIMHDTKLFSATDASKFGLVRGQSAADVGFNANESQRKFFVNLFGKDAAADALIANKPFTIALHDADVMLASGPFFDFPKATGGSQELQMALRNNFMGFRFISPPNSNQVHYAGELKEGERIGHRELPTKDQVANPKDFFSFVLANRRFTVLFDLFIPEEYARYMTQTPSGPINLSMLNMFWALWLFGDIGQSKAFDAVTAVSSLKNVRELNKEGRSYRPQLVNGEGLSISSDAYAYYVPTIDNIDVYEDEFLAFGTHTDGSYSLRPFDRLLDNEFTYGETREDKEHNKRVFPKNRIIYTDFCNFRIAYSDSEGLSNTKNIEDWTALRPTDAANILNRSVFADRTWNKSVFNDIMYLFENRLQDLGIDKVQMFFNSTEWERFGFDQYYIDHLSKDVTAGNQISYYFDSLKGVLATNFFRNVKEEDTTTPRKLEDVKFRHMFDGSVPGLQWFGDVLREAASRIRQLDETALNDYMTKRSVISAMKEIGTVLVLAENGIRQQEIFRADAEDRKAYLATKKPKKGEHKPRDLPFVQVDGKGRFLMPHQVRVDSIMENNDPKFVILAADAGGGKTLMVLRDVMSKLESGQLKRPILAMPQNLIRNYIADATYMFGAGLNCIPITTDSLDQHGAEGLAKIVAAAPKNSVLLTSYPFIRGSTEQVFYGTDVMDYSANLELLRSFNCDGIYCDESHFLRNDSAMTKATRRFAYSIPYRVLATGTLVNKELSDVANQVSIFMPSLFGNKSDFQEEYAEQMRGNTVVSWKPGAEAALRKKIAEHCLVIQCKRKEWAALLPNRVENIHLIGDADMRQSEWYQMYQAILLEAIELIKKDENIQKKLGEIDGASDDEEINIEALLRPYLQRLEMFLVAPEKDKLGSIMLKGKDRVGPKIHQINAICKEHFAKKIPGKILIFTNYHNSADSIYENLPADLKKMAIRYHSDNSDADLGMFERDPSKQILIGTENTLNTGHNLQMASRIIRVESTWTPGNLEQSMARVYRPDPKNISGVERTNIYLDWVIVNWTIDITKIARLISRVLNKALFDEHDNAAFADLPALPVVSMSLDSITSANDYDGSLADYAEGYSQYLEIVRQDLEAYRNDPENELVYTHLGRKADGMKDAALLALCPYSPDQSLPNDILTEFKLVRMSDYAREHGAENEGVAQFDAKGLIVHTERGEGKVIRSSGSTVRVELRDGSKIIVNKLAVFVVNDGQLPKIPVRRKLAQRESLPIANNLNQQMTPAVEKKDVTDRTPKAKDSPIVKRSMPAPVEKPNSGAIEAPPAGAKEIALEIYSIYDMLALDLEDVETLKKADLAKLEGIGFRTGGKFSMCDIPNLAKYDLFLEKLEENYVVSAANMKVLRDLRKAYTGGKNKLFTAHRALGMEMKNFWRIQSKPAAKNELRPYPIVWEGDLHIAVRHFKQPAALTVKQGLRVPGIQWQIVEDDYMLFCQDKQDVIKKVNAVQKAGFALKKPKAFMKSLGNIRMFKKKDDDK